MPTVERPDAEIYYEVHGGSGPAVVFAHGLGGNAASWWQQVPHFRDRYRVVIFDHRGFGRSRCRAENFHVKHFGTDLAALLDAADLERAALVCESTEVLEDES